MAGLQARDDRWKMRIGKFYGLPYVELKRGKWNIQLKFNNPARWSIQRIMENNPSSELSLEQEEEIRSRYSNPHWIWKVAPVGSEGRPEIAQGRVPELMVDSDPLVISHVVRFIAEDPCLVPGGKATAGFECPECKGDWAVPQFYPWDKWQDENNFQEPVDVTLEEIFMMDESEFWPLEPNPTKVGNLPLIADLFLSRND